MALEPLSDEEIERRLPVWLLLADSFLDTEFDDAHYEYVAEGLARSGYSKTELETIYREDVAPALVGNLFGIGGQWGAWNDDFVKERVLERRGSKLVLVVARVLLGDGVNDEWRKIAAKLDRIAE